MSFKNVYGGRHGTRAKYRIEQHQQTMLTEGHQIVNSIIASLPDNYAYEIEAPLPMTDDLGRERGRQADTLITGAWITPELKLPMKAAVLVDGSWKSRTLKRTRRMKRETETYLLNGYSVLRIDEWYTETKERQETLRVKVGDALFRLKTGRLTVERID